MQAVSQRPDRTELRPNSVPSKSVSYIFNYSRSRVWSFRYRSPLICSRPTSAGLHNWPLYTYFTSIVWIIRKTIVLWPVGICPSVCPNNGHVPKGSISRYVRSIGMFVCLCLGPTNCQSGFSGQELYCSGHALVWPCHLSIGLSVPVCALLQINGQIQSDPVLTTLNTGNSVNCFIRCRFHSEFCLFLRYFGVAP